MCLFPLLRRQNEVLALGYVTARIVECAFILVGILAVLSLVTLGQEDSGAEAGLIGYTLAEIKDWTFILGPGWVVGVGNGLILGYLMYRSGLVPRPLAALGLIGGPLIVLSGTLVLFDGIDPGGTGQSLATIPEFFWELGLGIYLTVKGFKPSPSFRGMPVTSRRRRLRHEHHPLIRAGRLADGGVCYAVRLTAALVARATASHEFCCLA